MKKLHLAAAALLLVTAGAASAQTSATQDVTITVTAVNTISVSSPTVAISVGVGTVHNTTTTYSVTTNSSTAKKITGQITTGVDFPTGITLKVNLTAPTVGTSQGDVTLTTAAADLVTGLIQVTGTGLQIDYSAITTVSAPVGAQGARTITFTIQ